MTRLPKKLTLACSVALFGVWSSQGIAQQNTAAQQSGEQKRSQQSQGQPNQKTAAQRVSQKAGQPTDVMIVGTITDARNVKLASTAGDQHRLLKVKPKSGEEIVVDIGVPTSQSTNLAKGDRIVAVGKPARINDRPVVFAASVGELQRVGRTSEKMNAQTTSNQQQSSTGSSANRTANNQGGDSQRDGYDAVIHLFTTDNLLRDEYGPYDEDFAWETNDSWYDSWNDTADSWDQTELPHYDLFGYDDAGEQGLFDW